MDLIRTRVKDKRIVGLLENIGRVADLEGARAYIVGGLVRDILIQDTIKIGAVPMDLDIVVEGDAIKLGKYLSVDLGGSLTVHRRFGTCTLATSGALKIDLATARKEEYESPACLPAVKFSTLKEDLSRRDFTINAMAISLSKDDFGKLIDFFGGEDDLRSGRVRVLHDKSFIDDPTRILRAVRFEQRLGFTIDTHTEKLILDAVRKNMFTAVEPQRVRGELILILKERSPLKVVRRMEDLHELRFIHPKLRLNKDIIKLFSNLDKACDWYETSHKSASTLREVPRSERPASRNPAIEKWLAYLMALSGRLGYGDVAAMENKFAFKKSERVKMLSYKRHGDRTFKLLNKSNLAPSAVYDILKGLPREAVILLLARSQSRAAISRIKAYIENYSALRANIRGHDIKEMGLKPGPRFKKILEKVLHRKIDGFLKTKEDEIDYVKKLIRER